MRILLFILPFLYCACAIVLPIYNFDTTYAMSMLLLFWIPSVIMLILNGKWLTKNRLWKPFLLTNLFLGIVSIYFEFSSLGIDVWGFSEDHHKLLPIPKIMGSAPIEEFMFYFGATPFCLLIYICFFRLVKRLPPHRDISLIHLGVGHLAWILIGMPFIPFLKYIGNTLKEQNVVSWLSVWLTAAAFWGTLGFVEHHAVKAGHWVYNTERILNVTLFSVPIEEFIIYYVLGPVFVVFFFHLMELKPHIAIAEKHSVLRGL